MASWAGRRLQSYPLWLFAAAVVVVSPQVFAWSQARAARAALVADRPEDALRHLRRCRAVWPWGGRPEVLLVGARASWQSGDLAGAVDELRAARRAAGATTPELALEWSLVQAADGNVAEVAEYLQQVADADRGVQRPVWEALAEGYLAVYRANDAFTVAQQWVSLYPDDPRGLELRGRAAIQGRGRGLTLGAADFREVLRLDPGRTKARVTLSTTLLDLGLFDEAQAELVRLVQDEPDRPDHRVRLARCLKMTNRADEAVGLLDAVIASHPGHGIALRTRGQFALADGRQAEAEGWLRRAAEALPNDYQTQYLYYQALQQAGRAEEAVAQLGRAEAVKQQSAQLADLRTRKLAERPLDPTLYAEMGSLLVKTGAADQGLRWLGVALSLDPNFRPAHEALATYYEAAGDRDRAAPHRRQASGGR